MAIKEKLHNAQIVRLQSAVIAPIERAYMAGAINRQQYTQRYSTMARLIRAYSKGLQK